MRTEIGPIRSFKSSLGIARAPQISNFFHFFTSWPIYEELVIFLVVHISPLWWGLNSLTLWYLGFSKWSYRTSQTWTKIILWIFYMYIDIGERRAEKQDGSTMIIEGPQVPQICIYIYFSQRDPYIWNISCSFVILVHVSTLWWNKTKTMVWNLF